MNIPRYWAEGRVQHREKGRQVTVRRFGWSRDTQEDAQKNADERAAEALKKILSGEKLDRRERKVAYNGAEGMPIREEIVAEHGNTVITRNSYGALCLNTPDVLFADVDYQISARPSLGCGFSLLLLVGAGVLAWGSGAFNMKLFLVLLLPCIVAGFGLARLVHRFFLKTKGGPKELAMGRVAAFAREHPDWSLRVYETPAGLRVIATQRTFDPSEAEVGVLFKTLHSDPMYVKMCQRQHCFRARVSPKPWRIGIERHLKPSPGIWPVRSECLPARKAWVDAYHDKSSNYASCRFEREIGGSTVDARVAPVVKLHDELCRAHSSLPIA